MSLTGKRIGIAFTGSFCTYEKGFHELEKLSDEGAIIQPIFSTIAASSNNRFGKAEDFLNRAKEITGQTPIHTIEGAV